MERFFLAVWGDPKPPVHAGVESGYFSVKGRWPPAIANGDHLLLYCREDHAHYPDRVPGFSIVQKVNATYRELFCEYHGVVGPQQLEDLHRLFEDPDQRRLERVRLLGNRLYEISGVSFWRTIFSSGG